MGILSFFSGKRAAPTKRKSVRRYERPRNLNGEPLGLGSSRYERVPTALAALRSACSHLVHTNPHAYSAVKALTTHTVGGGIRFAFSKVPGSKAYDAEFFRWANSTACDLEGRLSFGGIQAVAVRCQKEKGEAFIVIHDGNDSNDFWPRLQVVDPDALETGATPKYKDNLVVDGIEMKPSGYVVGYHFLFVDEKGTQRRDFIYADHMIHLLEIEQPGQMRGIPPGITVINRVQMHDALFQSVLAKAWVESCFGVAIKRAPRGEDDEMGRSIIDDMQGDEFEDAPGVHRPAGLNPGLMFDLDDDEEIQVINPSSLGGYDAYMRMSREDICAGYQVPYAFVTKDTSRSNYVSGKLDLVDFYSRIDAFRENFLYPCLMKIERAFRDAYELRTGEELDEMDVTLIPPRKLSLEPAKEALEDATRLVTGGMTWRQYVYKQGLDPDVQLEEIKREREELKAAGIMLKFGTEVIGYLADEIKASEAAAALDEKNHGDDEEQSD